MTPIVAGDATRITALGHIESNQRQLGYRRMNCEAIGGQLATLVSDSSGTPSQRAHYSNVSTEFAPSGCREPVNRPRDTYPPTGGGAHFVIDESYRYFRKNQLDSQGRRVWNPPRGEATGRMTREREASDHDATGITLFGGSGESCAFRARCRRLSRFPTHLEHPDQEARGVSRADADRAQREIVCVYPDGAGCCRKSTPDHERGG